MHYEMHQDPSEEWKQHNWLRDPSHVLQPSGFLSTYYEFVGQQKSHFDRAKIAINIEFAKNYELLWWLKFSFKIHMTVSKVNRTESTSFNKIIKHCCHQFFQITSSLLYSKKAVPFITQLRQFVHLKCNVLLTKLKEMQVSMMGSLCKKQSLHKNISCY